MFSFLQKHPEPVSSDLCFHNVFLKTNKSLHNEEIKPKIKLHKYKDADRTAEWYSINSQNQRYQLSFSVITVQVVKIYPNIKEQPITMSITS